MENLTHPQPERWKILIVDDEPNNLSLMAEILENTYEIILADSGEKALQLLVNVQPDLILLDIMMPGMDGYEVCRRLKSHAQTEKIPVIFITALSETGNEKLGFQVGAVDYITKPISVPILFARVQTHLKLYNQNRANEILIQRRTEQLELSQRAAVYMLGDAGHYHDDDTGVHIWRMASYAEAIAQAIGWSVEEIAMLKLASPMHDTGKIGIPDAILKKPGKLNAQEWEIMKTHTTIGQKILSKSKTPLFQLASEVAFCHHERWNGQGYSQGLKGTEIPESARIVAIADVFDALTMKRPYKAAWSIEDAFAEIHQSSGSHFDPHIVEKFFEIEDKIRNLKLNWETEEEKNNHLFYV